MKLPLQVGAALAVELLEGSVSELCRLSKLPRQDRSALQWTAEALASGEDAGANLAVRQAPLIAGVHEVGQRGLAGLPGWLADSLPDSWGRLLIDRQLRSFDIEPVALTGVDRLAIVGQRGPGALSYRPAFPLADDDRDEGAVDLDRVAQAAQVLLSGDSPQLLDRLATLGGSAGGSRPKAWIAVHDETGALRSGAAALREGETGWLVKFRAPQHDPEDIGPLEYAYALMARRAGLDVAEPRLFETDRGRYFASRRFDREGAKRRHVLTAAAFLDVPAHQAVTADYVDLLGLTRHITRSEVEVEQAFLHASFNVLAHNRDDHLKQYAFIRDGRRWRRAPAYDLTFSDGPGGEHTLLVAGEGRRPTRSHLLEVAERARLDRRKASELLDACEEAVDAWRDIAEEVGVEASLDDVAKRIAR